MVAGVLASHQVDGPERAHCLEYLGLLALHGTKALIGRGFHSKQCDDLEQVVLDDVAPATGAFVECTATTVKATLMTPTPTLARIATDAEDKPASLKIVGP